jgi:hypothetical protein
MNRPSGLRGRATGAMRDGFIAARVDRDAVLISVLILALTLGLARPPTLSTMQREQCGPPGA